MTAVDEPGVRAPAEPQRARRQILVLGMHRSGTSAVTRLLRACGAFVGDPDEMTEASVENPRGFFERRDARGICDALLHAAEADWWKVLRFEPERIPPAALAEQRASMARLIETLDAQGTWALKEPRLCLLLPVWRRFLDDPCVVMVSRSPLEVAQSLRYRNGFPTSVALALWEAYTVAALRNARDLPVVHVRYEELVDDPGRLSTRLTAELAAHGVSGLQARCSADAIEAGLHHERVGPDAPTTPLLTSEQRRLADRLERGETLPHEALALSPAARQILEEFELDETARRRREARRVDPQQLEAAQERARELQERSLELQERLDASEADRQAQARRAERVESTLDALHLELKRSETTVAVRDAELAEVRQRVERLAQARERLEKELASARGEAERERALARRRAQALEALASDHERATRRRRTLPRLPALAGAPRRKDRGRRKGSRRQRRKLDAQMRMVSESGLFDRQWYLERYPDVATAGMDPVYHYVRYGGFEGRDPGPRFGSRWYLDRNPDVAAAGYNPLVHYLKYGRDEGRLPRSSVDAEG